MSDIPIPDTGKMIARDYQREAYRAFVPKIREYSGPVFCDASVGAGKTMIMGMICANAQEKGMPVWVLARTGELVEQNAATFWDCGVKNSIFSASLGSKVVHYPVLVGTEKTVFNALNKELRELRPALLLIDECHELNYDDDDTQYMQIAAELKRRNPKLRVLGFSGSPHRNNRFIKGEFWDECVYRITTEYLVDRGFLMPTVFGFGDADGYDLSAFKPPEHEQFSDYSQDDLNAMQREILKNESKTAEIIAEVVEATKDRNAVMITGAGQKHLEMIAKYLPEDSYVIITQNTGGRKRKEGLKQISRGEKKYLLQIGCLTTGYDESLIDTSVMLRKIGSLRLLIQLLGRGMRLLKDRHHEAGYFKENHMVFDYTDTMAEMSYLYHNPILESAQEEKAKKEHKDLLPCPRCAYENSPHARRCRGEDPQSIDGRCEHFWDSEKCPECGVKNDVRAQQCRSCGHQLKDPNAHINRSHYTDTDYIGVKSMRLRLTKNREGIVVDFHLEDGEKATEIYFPKHKNPAVRNMWKGKFLKNHLPKSCPFNVYSMSVPRIVDMQATFDTPVSITHRKNDQGQSIIAHRKFRSGREAK